MATDPIVIQDPTVVLGGTDFSEGCKEVTFVIEADTEEITHARSGGWKEEVGKFKQGTITLKFLANKDRSTLEDFFWTNLGAAVTFNVHHRDAGPTTAVPHWTGNLTVNKHTAIGGGINGVETYDFTFKTTGAVTRATA